MSRELNATLVAAVLAVGFMVMFLSSAMKGLYQVYFVDLATHFGEGRAGLALANEQLPRRVRPRTRQRTGTGEAL